MVEGECFKILIESTFHTLCTVVINKVCLVGYLLDEILVSIPLFRVLSLTGLTTVYLYFVVWIEGLITGLSFAYFHILYPIDNYTSDL